MQRKILIVDDMSINRGILKKILGDEYDTIEASNGIEALSALENGGNDVSVVLLDLGMPVMNGFGVLEKMRSDARLSTIPVIVTTVQTQEQSEVRALSLGANDYITKPYNATIIKQRVRNTIRLRESAATVNALQRDELTGLDNRTIFFQRVQAMIARHEPGYYVMASFDIDNFKVINDQYGTEKGDCVLRHVAACLNEFLVPREGLCCRVMADNFAILYPSRYIGTRELEQNHRQTTSPDCIDRPISIRIGRYIVAEPSLSASAMYDRATMAEVSIKGQYGVYIAQYDESMRLRLLREQKIVNEMNDALAEGQFEVWFQPQFNHSNGALIGAEALVRWRHPQRGLICPDEFIPVFERNGFIYELDKYVWEQTCVYLRRWLDKDKKALPVSVNISRYDLFRDDLTEVIEGLIKKYSIPVSLLRLEITESAFASSTDVIIDVVEELTAVGFIIELDDFGSGYSSLNTLKDVPAKILKLDMKFLRSGRNSTRGGNIIESIVRMAKWLGMPVIAEGVETMAQADYLRSIGCLYIQGYLYARPMPAEEYESFGAGLKKEKEMLRLETVDNLDNNAFWDPNSIDTLVFNSYIGGACIFEYYNGRTELLRINENYVRELSGGRLSLSEAQSLELELYMDEKNREILNANILEAVKTERETGCEVRLCGIAGDGKSTYIRTTVRIIARAGERYLLYCAIFNMTALREAERKENEAYRRIATLVEDIPGGFCQMLILPDGRARIVFINNGFCKLVGMTRDKVLAEYESDALGGVHPGDIANVRAVFGRTLDCDDGSFSVECRIRHGTDGYTRCVLFGRTTRTASGDVYVNAFYTDITGEQVTKEPITPRELLPPLFAAMMSSPTEPAFVKDRELVYLCCSRGFARLAGKGDESEVIGRTDYDLFPKEQADKLFKEDISLMKGGGAMKELKEGPPSDDGVAHYLKMSRYLLYDTAGGIIGIYGVSRNVTGEGTI